MESADFDPRGNARRMHRKPQTPNSKLKHGAASKFALLSSNNKYDKKIHRVQCAERGDSYMNIKSSCRRIACAATALIMALPACAPVALADTYDAPAGIVGAFAYGEMYDQYMVNAAGNHIVTASALNVRSGAGKSYPVISRLRRGDRVHVDAIQGDFCRITSSDGAVGYVARQYLDPVSDSATATPRPTGAPTSAVYPVYAVTASLLNVRTGPAANASLLCKLQNGTRVSKISDVDQNWMQVRLSDGRYGYVMSRYMTRVSSGGATAAPTTAPRPTSAPQPTSTAGEFSGLEAGDIYQATSNVNLRSGPGVSYSSKRVLTSGTYVTLKNKVSTDWYFVRTREGVYGYVRASYLRYVRTIAETPTPAPTQPIVNTTEQIYSFEQMKADIAKLYERYPGMVSSRVAIGNTMWNEQIPAICIGNQSASKALLIDGGIHGREYMSTLLIMRQIEYLLDNQNAMYDGRTISSMLSECCIWFIPMINPDGVRISQTGLNGLNETQKNNLIAMNGGSTYFTRWKANGYGVDLNRNFESGWHKNGQPSGQDYSGSYANSESETQAMVNFVRSHPNIKASINYHTTGNCIYWHYGQTGNAKARDKRIANSLSSITGYFLRDENYTGKGGGFMDWMIASQQLPSFTLELGNGSINAPQDIKYFPAIWSANRDVPAFMLKYIIDNL